MKFTAAILLFTSALALAAPAEDGTAPGVDVDNTPVEDFTDGDLFTREIARGRCNSRGRCQGRFANRRNFNRACTDGSCRNRRGQPCNVSTNVNPNRVVCPGAS